MKAFIIISFLFVSTYSLAQENIIIPIDFDAYEKLFIPPMTEKESYKIYEKQNLEIKEKSIGKQLPDIYVKTLKGDSILLKYLITEKTLCAFADSHCGFGLESLTNDLPKALNRIKSDGINLNTIAIYIIDTSDDLNSTRIKKNLIEITELHPNTYILKNCGAKKINIIGGVTRYYFNDDGVLMEIKGGLSNVDRLTNEIIAVYKSL